MKSAINTCSVDDSTRAILLNTIGVIYSTNRDYLNSIRYFESAVQIIQQRLGSATINPGYLSLCYYFLSNAYDSIHNVNAKYRFLDSCVKTGSKYNVFTGPYINALIQRAEYCFHIGDYKSCYSYADMGEKVALAFLAAYPQYQVFSIQSARVATLHKINALVALKDYSKAMKAARDQFSLATSKDYLGTIYGQMAYIQTENRQYALAQSYLDSSFQYIRKFGTTANGKVALNNMGVLRWNWFHNAAMAIPYYIKSYQYKSTDLTTKSEDTVETVNALANLGIAYSLLPKFDSAYYYFNLAFEYVGKGWNETVFLNNLSDTNTNFTKLDYLLKLLSGKAEAYTRDYKFSHNLQRLSEALKISYVIDKSLFKIKSEQSNLISKLALRENYHDMYENAMKTCWLKNDFESAFYFMERSKAILLLDQLSEERWTAQNDLQKQNQLKKQILSLTRRLESMGNSSTASDSVNKELFRKQQELEAIKSQIESNSPLFYQYSMDTGSLRIKDVQANILKEHDAFLEMFSGDSAVYALMITRNKVELKRINKIAFDTLSKSFIHFVSNGEMTIDNFNYCTTSSTQLYHLIFDQLTLPKGRIIISPDGRYFPFEALATSQQHGAPNYFIEDHAVSYTYSARYLGLSFARNANISGRNFMGMAPVQFESNFQLTELRGSDASINRLTSNFSQADSYISKEASRKEFLQNFSRYKLIQLYAHAADSGYYNEPVIYFADSALMLSDLLYEQPPSTQLIVLSGCETALGKLYEGEGAFSFNRGFAAIGIPSCVANLWQVENTSTYQLTELFYAKLAKGLPLDIALQEAKKEFIKNASHEKQLPFYWAAPILTGRTDAIQLKKNYTWIFVTAGVCLLAFVVVVVVLPRIRKRAPGN